jgi:hypothetical protein
MPFCRDSVGHGRAWHGMQRAVKDGSWVVGFDRSIDHSTLCAGFCCCLLRAPCPSATRSPPPLRPAPCAVAPNICRSVSLCPIYNHPSIASHMYLHPTIPYHRCDVCGARHARPRRRPQTRPIRGRLTHPLAPRRQRRHAQSQRLFGGVWRWRRLGLFWLVRLFRLRLLLLLLLLFLLCFFLLLCLFCFFCLFLCRVLC